MNKTETKKMIQFTDELARICSGLGISLQEDITLRMYLSYEKVYTEKIKALNKANKNGK